MSALKIGINALYLIPGKVGGTEVYLRSLLRSLAAMDATNRYYVYVNREAGADIERDAPGFHIVHCNVEATFRPWRILYEQTILPCLLATDRIDVLLNPGFTMPIGSCVS